MTQLHTPGPWEWWTSNSWLRLRHSDRGVSTNVLMPVVCKDGQATIDVSPADMALIKAGPEMLAALKGAMVIIETVPWPDYISDGIRAAFDKRRTAIIAAIAKAEGRTP